MKETIRQLHEISASIEKMCKSLGLTDEKRSKEINQKISRASKILDEADIDFTKLVHDYADLRFKNFNEKKDK